MSRYAILLSPCLVLLLLLSACKQDAPVVPKNTHEATTSLQLLPQTDAEWRYENLKIYPVTTDETLAETHSGLKNLKVLAEVIQTKEFRVTERKQFGRTENWYNSLTIQNRSQDTIFMMSGDVVTGGNQDRMIAYEQIVLPATVKNIEVFCVEQGRSHYYDANASAAEKKLAAFNGYYNVAGPAVRKAVQGGQQQEVWDAVSAVTSKNQATSDTKTYAALDHETDQKKLRDAYLHFFEGKLAHQKNLVGLIAVCDGEIIGADIFGHPNLFSKCSKALLHGYVAEAATRKPTKPTNQQKVQSVLDQLTALTAETSNSNELAVKFSIGKQWVHLFAK